MTTPNQNQLADEMRLVSLLEQNPPPAAPQVADFPDTDSFLQAQRQHRQMVADYQDELAARKARIPLLRKAVEEEQAEIAAIKEAANPKLEKAAAAGAAVIAAIEALRAAIQEWDECGPDLLNTGVTRLNPRAGTTWRVDGLSVDFKTPTLIVDHTTFRVTLSNWRMPASTLPEVRPLPEDFEVS